MLLKMPHENLFYFFFCISMHTLLPEICKNTAILPYLFLRYRQSKDTKFAMGIMKNYSDMTHRYIFLIISVREFNKKYNLVLSAWTVSLEVARKKKHNKTSQSCFNVRWTQYYNKCLLRQILHFLCFCKSLLE